MTQVDLPRNTRSGLRNVIEVLRDVEGISFTFFTARDVVRHPLVAKIVRAYEAAEEPDGDTAALNSPSAYAAPRRGVPVQHQLPPLGRGRAGRRTP